MNKIGKYVQNKAFEEASKEHLAIGLSSILWIAITLMLVYIVYVIVTA